LFYIWEKVVTNIICPNSGSVPNVVLITLTEKVEHSD